jgi:hypothetical protein
MSLPLVDGDLEAFKARREADEARARANGAPSRLAAGTWGRFAADHASPRARVIARIDTLYGLRGWQNARLLQHELIAFLDEPVADALTLDDMPWIVEALLDVAADARRHGAH